MMNKCRFCMEDMEKIISRATTKLEDFLAKECREYSCCTECPYGKAGYDAVRYIEHTPTLDEKYAYAVEILLNL